MLGDCRSIRRAAGVENGVLRAVRLELGLNRGRECGQRGGKGREQRESQPWGQGHCTGPDPEGPQRGRDGRSPAAALFILLASVSASTMKGSSLKRQRRLRPEEEPLAKREGPRVSLSWTPKVGPSPREAWGTRSFLTAGEPGWPAWPGSLSPWEPAGPAPHPGGGEGCQLGD